MQAKLGLNRGWRVCGIPVVHGAVLVQLGLVGQDGGHEGRGDEEEGLVLHCGCGLVVGV